MGGRKNRILKYSVLFKKMGVLNNKDFNEIVEANKIIIKKRSD
ncbi:hypothetical protein [Cytobacillus purgationiresistens]|uniref:Uncharacterized protein n=1 Tax=Cytobacillus purgationiresistens TaxID=863449 RepID=A0ABU0AAV8_9BACI|nr:hypothetical protein [Cytobacillus purgationiresistens]MDQ0268391.1 hypothetical protein [Cytobacillus purgationiresistens]